MPAYDVHEIERKWQDRWADQRLYAVGSESGKPKWYFLLMFPYPSGPLHCGHWFMYGPPDAKARYLRMRGYDVLFPMGFDAFGLPAENAAIKRAIPPQRWTYANIEQMKKSFRRMGGSFDPDRWIATCDPSYYRWTQWIFLQLYKRGLAYRAFSPVDWCPSCNTTLAREQVIGDNRECERCQTAVVKRELNQWFFRITEYAEELLDFSQIDWPERIKLMQTNWIGRSEGADLVFKTERGVEIRTFTTRPDTVFGVTFLALAPEHPLLEELTDSKHAPEVKRYVAEATRRTEIERLATGREKTGVPTGCFVANPATGDRVPVFVSDYVVMQYGSGAVMGVPAHDQRDFEFAKRYGLPIRMVVAPEGWTGGSLDSAHAEAGTMIASDQFDGLTNDEAKGRIVAWLASQKLAEPVRRYRLRDWLVSRQRYWGAPIPIVHCNACGTVPVPESQLPVRLPEDVEFTPTGESPLKAHAGFLETTCPECGGPASRETDTMDTFVDSSWYWYRYLSPNDEAAFYDRRAAEGWLPVSEYAGGPEHATMHLLYARFVAKALRDMGYVAHGEPFKRLFNQGLVLGEDNEKMSKSRGNVVDPETVLAGHGADILRAFLMFLGPWAKGGAWSSDGISGIERFFNRAWRVIAGGTADAAAKPAGTGHASEVRALERKVHETIRLVGDSIESFTFNRAIAALMELVNVMTQRRGSAIESTPEWAHARKTLVLLLAPIAPHFAEELWERLGHAFSVHQQPWPAFNEALLRTERCEIAVQVNGTLRGRIEVDRDASEDEVRKVVLSSPQIAAKIGNAPPRKIIFVPGRLINFVIAR